MQTCFLAATALLGFASSVSAHGYIRSPLPRSPGPKMEKVCGQPIYNNQKADNAGPVQLLMQSAASITDPASCNLWLCKGYQFDDNTANVQTYSLGQTIPFEINIVAPHSGYANVSIVNTKTNSVVGSALKSWDDYASTSTGVTADETSFSITMPETLEGCTTAGECVIQWFWYAPPSVDQTYESCIDFVVGKGSAAPAASAATSSSVAASTSAAASAAFNVIQSSIKETTSAVAASAPAVTSSAPAATSSAPAATSSVAAPVISAPATTQEPAPVTSAAPTTLATKTRSSKPAANSPPTNTAAPAPAPTSGSSTGGTKSPESINKCLDAVNACIAKAQSKTGGASDLSTCDAQRAACY